MPLRVWLPLAALVLLAAGEAGALFANHLLPSEPGRRSAPSLLPRQADAGLGGEAVAALPGAELTPLQVRSIDPEREPSRWVEAVEALRARLDRFASDSTSEHARRREEGEELLRLVDAFATRKFYLPGQQSQVKLEIARQIYGDEPELMAELTREYETDALNEAQRFEEDREAELARDPRFQAFKAQEAALIDSIVRSTPPGPERDAAVASETAALHHRIFDDPLP